MGEWLKINGEAIYGSVPWSYQNDTVNSKVGTPNSVRYQGRLQFHYVTYTHEQPIPFSDKPI